MQDITVNQFDSIWLIWDDDNAPPEGGWRTILWRSFNKNGEKVISMPQFIEDHADIIKKRYLAYIYSLGESNIRHTKLIDHLEIRPGFSYWWMTLLNEKCNVSKSLQIPDVLKVMALHLLSKKIPPSKVILISKNKTLKKTLYRWFKKEGIPFEWDYKYGENRAEAKHFILKKNILRCVYSILPCPLKAAISLLFYIIKRWPLRGEGLERLKNSKAFITFCSYFDNLDRISTENGRFFSYYWTVLSDFLNERKIHTCWIQIFIKDGLNPTAREAKAHIDNFNRNQDFQLHIPLDCAISLSTVLSILYDYIRICVKGLRMRGIREHFIEKDSGINFWFFLKDDWRASMYGQVAMSNCIFLNLFENVLRHLPEQNLGFYLQENQAWEMAYIYTWKRYGHKTLIAVPHSTVRYWDLRYFYDPGVYTQNDKNRMPLPDKVAVNGQVSLNMLREGGFPEARLVEVEALRYLHLAATSPMDNKPFRGHTNLLAVTDYNPEFTKKQIEWLRYVIQKTANIYYIIKPHPNCPVSKDELPFNNVEISYLPIERLLKTCDLVYAGPTTSAAVDAYCSGLPVICMIDGNSLNLSPLRNMQGVYFVRSADELLQVLSNCNSINTKKSPEPFFNIDPNIPLWKALIDQYVNAIPKQNH